jgi:RNA polymerase sigma factor (TIGR02999 family)
VQVGPHGDVTALLVAWAKGDEEARDRLIPLVYDDLRRRAAGYLRRERPGHTLDPTALVHEAFLRLVDQGQAGFESRSHFLAIAARVMRQVLVDHARTRQAAKREGGRRKVSLDEAPLLSVSDDASGDLLDLEEALQRLGALDPRKVEIVEMRYFGGLSVDETAEVLGLSPATIKRDWSLARAYLHRHLTQTPRPPRGPAQA